MKQLTSPLLAACMAVTFLNPTALAQAPGPRAIPRNAQPPAVTAEQPPPGFAEADADATREQLRQILQRYPPEVGRILKMDPTMITNSDYLTRYPALATFLAAHPQVAHNPDYFLGFVRYSYDYNEPADPSQRAIVMWREVMEGLMIFTVMVFIASVGIWLVRSLLDHRRWLRVSRIQTEVHNKLLDRFAGTNELLAYVQTPAGRRFLEAAPIPLDPGAQGAPAPMNRILWSIQIGVVLAVGGLGFQFISGRVIQEVAEGLWMIGVLAIAFGIGFILSGVVSFFLSRRLGLFETAAPLAPDRGETPGI